MNRFAASIIAVLVLLTFSAASAQDAPLPLPEASARGAYAPSAPFAIPPEYASRARGQLYYVNTLADEDDGDCAGDNVALSLREALTYCAASAITTVYIPPGTYTLNGDIDLPDFNSLTLIGADPFSTFIHVNPTPCTNGCTFVNATLADSPLVVMNLTVEGIESNGAFGGAFDIAGYGTVDFYNMRFLGNTSHYGGAIYIVASGGGILATLNHTLFENNESSMDGGALVFFSYNSNGSTLRVSNSRFKTNTAGTCGTYAGGAIGFYTGGAFGNDFVVENSTFDGNTAPCGGGGALYAWSADDSAIAVTVQDSIFTGNSAKMTDGQLGGAIAITNPLGSVQIQDSTFTGNQSQYGGGVNVFSAKQVAIDGSTFTDNTAAASGGGVIVGSQSEPIDSISITNSTLAGNRATYGGGAYLLADVVVIKDSSISGNSSTDYGGGLEFDIFGGVFTLENTMLADNTSPIGPDCYIDDPDARLISHGGNWLGSNAACPFIPAAYDEFDNLLVNGGFELAQILPTPSANKPAGWKVKNPGKGKRVCDTPAKPTPVEEYGKCAFVFTGGTGAKASITQNIPPESVLSLSGEDMLLLSALGSGTTKSKVQLQLTLAYATGKPSKTKFTFNASYAHLKMGYAFSSLTIGPNPITKITVTAADKSKSGKFVLDAVFVTLVPADPRTATRAAPEDGVLPPPAAPPGMRGGN